MTPPAPSTRPTLTSLPPRGEVYDGVSDEVCATSGRARDYRSVRRLVPAVAAILLVACAEASAATISSNPEGDTAVAFQSPIDGPSATAFAALRPAGGVFGRPVRLARHVAWGAHVAVGPGGAAVAAWNQANDGAVRASFRDAGGSWGAPATLAGHGR